MAICATVQTEYGGEKGEGTRLEPSQSSAKVRKLDLPARSGRLGYFSNQEEEEWRGDEASMHAGLKEEYFWAAPFEMFPKKRWRSTVRPSPFFD